MSSGAAQLRFAADFCVFLVAGAGIALFVLRPALLLTSVRLRPLVGVGLALLAGASLVHGGGFVDAIDAPGLVAARLLAVVGIAAAPWRWPGSPAGRAGMWTGLVAMLAAEAVLAAGGDLGADWARLIGALALGSGVFLAARRSIPVRIATSASAIVLAVILAVSLGLSAIIANNVEEEAANRLVSRVATEAQIAEEAGDTALQSADPTAGALGGNDLTAQAIARLADPADPTLEADTTLVTNSLGSLVVGVVELRDPNRGPVLLVAPDGSARELARVLPEGPVPDEALLAGLRSNPAVTEALGTLHNARTIVVAGSGAFGVAAVPVFGAPSQLIAVLVVSSPLDTDYLARRVALSDVGSDGGLAFVGATGVVARQGAVGPDGALQRVAETALGSIDGEATRTDGGLLLAARVVRTPDLAPIVTMVAATTTASIQATRSDLFDLLFLISVGATLLALVLASVVGERIGSGLRQLTVAAGEVTGGNLLVRPEVRSDDELGVLSDAFTSMTGSLRGMTAELRQAADDEARLRTRLEGVVGGMGDALVAVDEHGDITDFNAAAELLTGIAARKAIGRPAARVVRIVGDDGTDLAEVLAAPSEEAWSAPGTVVHVAGMEVPVVVSAGMLRDAAGAVIGAVYVLRDVRREREVERVKSEFLANISHELRTPLSPIKGYSQILRTRQIPMDDVRRFANEIEKASGRLERVVVQLVNFASMSAGRFEVRVEPANIREVLDRVITRWTDRLDPDKHAVTRRVGRGVPKVWLDRQAIDQALEELVDNAVKYSPDGGRIELIATPADADGTPVVRIAVTDRGVGIPADQLDAVLGDFTQADGSNTRAYGGLGLGLALVGRIARAHGGWMELASREGRGTVVTLVLPVDGPAGAT